ncbi:MAG: phenylalanine--tRNA ligase subunit beta [Planctomycetota bacterium]
MDASLTWLSSLMRGEAPLTVEEADRALTAAGFPLDGVDPRDGDALLDVEVTSNRGDCLCHLGLAREIAALTGRVLTPRDLPEPGRGEPVGTHLTLENRCAAGGRPACPIFTAHVILGCSIGPSPAWLRELLERVGQRSINNAVDVTNWLNLELGNPSHVFDLDALAGRTLVVREAAKGEPLETLDGIKRELHAGEIVVADAERATSLAGVIGGAASQVHDGTTSIVLEVATWDPARVRAAARAHAVRTDASHRFERVVDPRTCASAADAAARLIAHLAGGTLCEGMLIGGTAMPEATTIPLRPERCARVLGIETPADEIVRLLAGVDIAARPDGDALACTVPPWRAHDVTREADLIEEIVRLRGFDAVPMAERLPIRVQPPQPAERAAAEIRSTLAGLGFFETVTFSFVSPEKAAPFLPPGAAGAVDVDDDRRGAEPTLRPSPLPSLLACRALNRDAQVHQPGGVRLFEMAAAYWASGPSSNEEVRRLAMLVDAAGDGPNPTPEQIQEGVRSAKGAIEALVAACFGRDARLVIKTGDAPPAMDAANTGRLVVRRVGGTGVELGFLGLPTEATLRVHDLDRPVVLAELDARALLDAYPATPRVESLPAFPGIERDLSVIVPAETPWADIESVIESLELERLERVGFVGTYAGKQVGRGKKSVTLTLAFRDADRTLRHDEVDPQVDRAVAALRERLAAELRT